jgi:hypothetical protein
MGDEGPVIAVMKGNPRAEMTIRKALVVVFSAKVHMRKGEGRYEREEGVLETSRSLQHKRLAAW